MAVVGSGLFWGDLVGSHLFGPILYRIANGGGVTYFVPSQLKIMKVFGNGYKLNIG